ncbi:MAG: carbamoyltransferase HypF, partial [Sulfurimonadaceae bacterium]|nr:carbamoyltransferase HypF [Sulfurimonadaceae bacterium]
MKKIRKAIFLTGVVQGVGMRPHIYKLAHANNLSGFVYNNGDGVHLEVEGKTDDIDSFLKKLETKLPPLARIDSMACHTINTKNDNDFTILKSPKEGLKTTLIGVDTKTCHECLDDIRTPGRYHNYFAINCTNCGPRYTIINTLPYDRDNTAMQPFGMCPACQEEYNNPTNRRYHAQPTSCNLCGLELSLYGMSNKIKTKNIYAEIAKEIKNGKIVAIKSIGGFHLVCDATNDAVVGKLRKEKNRPKKPFALMCKDITQIKKFAECNEIEEEIISSKENPIVVIKKNQHAMISPLIAPDIHKIGVMLAPSALHHLLFDYLNMPIVATSANLADEPLIVSKEEILKKLPFVDCIVDHNREIINALDDSLVQVSDGKLQMLRLGRGYTPTVLKLKNKITEKIVALGAHTKNSIAFASGDSLI